MLMLTFGILGVGGFVGWIEQGFLFDFDLFFCLYYSKLGVRGGSSARYALFSAGVMDAFLAVVAKRPDGSYVYSLGKKSRYIPFPIKDFFVSLNSREGLDENNGWGGSDIIGGSSREFGSKLEPKEVFEIIESKLKEYENFKK